MIIPTPQVELVATPLGAVEVASVGAGPAVLVIHGIPGSWRQGLPLAHDLADRRTVILPSRPGYGRTPVSSGRTPSEQAALYAAVLDARGDDQVAVIGISGGGPSALAFAQEHAGRTTSLALLCAVAGHLIDVPRAMRIGAAAPPLASAVSRVQRRIQRRFLDDPARRAAHIAAELTPQERAWLAEDPGIGEDLADFLRSHADAPPGLAGLRNDTRQLVALGRLGPAPSDRVVAPTLVMHGDADPVVPLAHAEHHAAVIPGAELRVFAGAGHAFLLTRRSLTSTALRHHLHQEAT